MFTQISRIASSVLIAATACAASGATFSANGGGLTGTSSVIKADGTGDYVSLAAAVQDITNYTFVNADYTLYIGSDLVEPKPVSLRTNSAKYKLSIKPLDDTPRTVTFDIHTTNTFGSGSPAFSWMPANISSATFNASINGMLSNGQRGLTFVFNPLLPTEMEYEGLYFFSSGTMEVTGCNFQFDVATSVTLSVLRVDTYQKALVTLTDNYIAGSNGSEGITMGASHPGFPSDTLIARNVIHASSSGITVYGRDADILQNDILINSPPERYIGAVGIVLNRGNAQTTSSIISRNKVAFAGSRDSLVVQGIRTYASADTTGTFLVNNNMVSLNVDVSSETRTLRGITMAYRRPTVSEVAHNSVYLPSNQEYSEETGRTFHSLGIESASSNTVAMVNNMAYVGTKWSAAWFYDDYNDVRADGNVFGLSGDTVAVSTAATTYTLLADWQAASGDDINSQMFNPADSWASPTDLHIANPAGLQPGVTTLLQYPVLTDFDGDPRSTTTPTPGCDEALLTATIGDWTTY